MITLYVIRRYFKGGNYTYEIMNYYDTALESATTPKENLITSVILGIKVSYTIMTLKNWENLAITVAESRGKIMETFEFR